MKGENVYEFVFMVKRINILENYDDLPLFKKKNKPDRHLPPHVQNRMKNRSPNFNSRYKNGKHFR